MLAQGSDGEESEWKWQAVPRNLLFPFFPPLESSAATMRLLGVVIAGFNKAIIAEKWQTFISFGSSASRRHRGRFKEYDLITSLASGGFIPIRVEKVVLFRRLSSIINPVLLGLFLP